MDSFSQSSTPSLTPPPSSSTIAAVPTRQQFRHWTRLVVQWGDMDALGHVNNVVYFRYFETGRVHYLEAVGASGFGERSDVPVVAHIGLNFRRPAVYPATLDVGIRVPKLNNRSFTMECAMFLQETDTLIADGTAAVVWIDKTTGKSLALPEAMRQAIIGLEQLA